MEREWFGGYVNSEVKNGEILFDSGGLIVWFWVRC
jgi:hypothetical protein